MFRLSDRQFRPVTQKLIVVGIPGDTIPAGARHDRGLKGIEAKGVCLGEITQPRAASGGPGEPIADGSSRG